MPKILLPEHHSVSDWDYQYGVGYITLDATYFVGAPTSLKIVYTPGGYPEFGILSRFATTLCLPQGELRSWQRSQASGDCYYTFRNQKAVGSADMVNCYKVNMTNVLAQLIRRVGGVGTLVGTIAIVHAANTWEHWRLVWWNGNTLGGVDALCFNFYKEIGGVWVQQGATLYDTVQAFKLSATNRVGLCSQTGPAVPCWFDETEIWGP